jgi:hypothetical protein
LILNIPKKADRFMPWLCFDKSVGTKRTIIKPPRRAREEVVSITNFHGNEPLTFNKCGKP